MGRLFIADDKDLGRITQIFSNSWHQEIRCIDKLHQKGRLLWLHAFSTGAVSHTSYPNCPQMG
jgi:hypothetical protein